MNIALEVPEPSDPKVKKILARIKTVDAEVRKVLDAVNAELNTKYPDVFQFSFAGVSRNGKLITDDERAQAISFVSRFEHLPILDELTIRYLRPDYYAFTEYHTLRLLLNEYRSILYNRGDSVYYNRIHSYCYTKMKNRDKKKELVVTVLSKEKDVTEHFMAILGERNAGVKRIIEMSDFDYLYNGVLQHSDNRFTSRFLEEYTSGELNWVMLKNSYLCEHAKELLGWHYKIVNALTYPKLGTL